MHVHTAVIPVNTEMRGVGYAIFEFMASITFYKITLPYKVYFKKSFDSS